MEPNELFTWVVCAIALAAPFYLVYSQSKLWKQRQTIKHLEDSLIDYQERFEDLEYQYDTYFYQMEPLKKYQAIVDVEAEVAHIQQQAEDLLAQAEDEYQSIVAEAKDYSQQKHRDTQQRAESTLRRAQKEAGKMRRQAETKAREIAGAAWQAKKDAEHYTETANAMKNLIEGYGNQYLIPNETVLDEIATEYSHEEAGQRLQQIQAQISWMIKDKEAADCSCTDPRRRAKIMEFVLNAFNSKVDSIIARIDQEDFGKLSQQLVDAYRVINHNGKHIQNARITEPYYNLIKQQLKMAVAINELKRQETKQMHPVQAALQAEETA